ncbi:MAG: stage III sporulation protein AD [Clostridiales bacterium]|nr:stage III sporulation protein AD [Clostridiales bacterium]
MDILKIAAVGIITAFCSLTIKESKSNLGITVGIAGGCIIMLMIVDYFAEIFAVITSLIEGAGISSNILKIVIKIIGIGYITEFAAGIIEDAGNSSVAEKIVIAGKVIILVVSLPIITALFDLVAELVK